MLSYTPMRRVLFLVDRNNLGKQAEGEFGTFRLTENGEAFNTIFTVNRLRSSSIPSDSNVVISTIQRLFSFLKGETIEDNDDDENEPIEEVTLPPNPNLPHDYFDMIIIDECHRSIYGNWRKVLEYFDTARLVYHVNFFIGTPFLYFSFIPTIFCFKRNITFMSHMLMFLRTKIQKRPELSNIIHYICTIKSY